MQYVIYTGSKLYQAGQVARRFLNSEAGRRLAFLTPGLDEETPKTFSVHRLLHDAREAGELGTFSAMLGQQDMAARMILATARVASEALRRYEGYMLSNEEISWLTRAGAFKDYTLSEEETQDKEIKVEAAVLEALKRETEPSCISWEGDGDEGDEEDELDEEELAEEAAFS